MNYRNDPASFQASPNSSWPRAAHHVRPGGRLEELSRAWLSEGFAQYFAALYAKEKRGEGVFRDVLRQLCIWAVDDSDQGPVYLGYRLGHIKGESRVFRALVYNKGAAVLHMLRRLIGDEAFFSGLKQFYASNRFKRRAPTICAWRAKRQRQDRRASSSAGLRHASRAWLPHRRSGLTGRRCRLARSTMCR